MGLLNARQELEPQRRAYVDQQCEMDLLDSWIERIVQFLDPTDPQHTHLKVWPLRLHMPDAVIVRLPQPLRDSFCCIIGHEMGVVDTRTCSADESTACLRQLSTEELCGLARTMMEVLDEVQRQSKTESEAVQYPLEKEWGSVQQPYDAEMDVIIEMEVLQLWCERAMAADVDDGLPLDKCMKVAELLVNGALA